MTTTQTIRLTDPTMAGRVLCCFQTAARDYRAVLAEALAMLHPGWAAFSHMEAHLQAREDGEWIAYL